MSVQDAAVVGFIPDEFVPSEIGQITDHQRDIPRIAKDGACN
jgi:hypothetical protein